MRSNQSLDEKGGKNLLLPKPSEYEGFELLRDGLCGYLNKQSEKVTHIFSKLFYWSYPKSQSIHIASFGYSPSLHLNNLLIPCWHAQCHAQFLKNTEGFHLQPSIWALSVHSLKISCDSNYSLPKSSYGNRNKYWFFTVSFIQTCSFEQSVFIMLDGHKMSDEILLQPPISSSYSVLENCLQNAYQYDPN